jgi:hypothetical protein
MLRSLYDCNDSITREKERRTRGQQLNETQEERERMLRKLEAEKIKREKMVREIGSGLLISRVLMYHTLYVIGG